MTDTATGLIRTAFQETDHAQLDHPGLVPDARPPMRRRRRDLHLHLPRTRALAGRYGITRRRVLLGSAGPAAWTIAMIALAWRVRY